MHFSLLFIGPESRTETQNIAGTNYYMIETIHLFNRFPYFRAHLGESLLLFERSILYCKC
jgi:hypothetical protein